MTLQAATSRESQGGTRALIGATAFTVVALVGAALWLVRSDGEAAPDVPASIGTRSEGATRPGGAAGPGREPYVAAGDAAAPVGEPALTDGFGRSVTQQVAAARLSANGMPELDGEAVAASAEARGGARWDCGMAVRPAVC